MSFLDTHSSSVLKPQAGFPASEGPKPQPDPNVAKAQLLAANREQLAQQPSAQSSLAAMMLGSKPAILPSSGKTSTSFYAQSTGSPDEAEADSLLNPFGQFLTRHTTLPWNNQGNRQDGPLFSTLNFMS